MKMSLTNNHQEAAPPRRQQTSSSSRWGAPLQPPPAIIATSAAPESSAMATASALPEKTNSQQHHHDDIDTKNSSLRIIQKRENSAAMARSGHFPQQHQRRGYEMNHDYYNEKEEYQARSLSSSSSAPGDAVGGSGGSDRVVVIGQGGRKYSFDCTNSSNNNNYNNNRGHYPRDDDNDRDNEDWRCLECGMWNYPRDDRCHRCQYHPKQQRYSAEYQESLSHQGRTKKRRFDDSGGERGGRILGDEQQQQQQQHDKYKQLRDQFNKRQKEQRRGEWPPSFDTEGASFLFDSRSGMFYHPPSDFFYDPKTKLYYSNKKTQYFRFVGGDDSTEIPFLPLESGGGGGGIEAAVAAGEGGGSITEGEIATESSKSAAGSDSEQKSKMIAISLKTKAPFNPSSKSLNEVAATEKQNMAARSLTADTAPLLPPYSVVPQSHKKHEEDMNKWSGRIKELYNNETVSSAENPDPSSAPRELKTTSRGQPICLLCRRKFASVEKLDQHEKLSALHKENLAKKASVALAADADKSSKQNEEEASSYRDRSKERRMMYGDDLLAYSHSLGPSSRAEAILAQVDGRSRTATTAEMTKEIIRPEDTLGNTNVGNKLLQKLGWKSGDTLGRKQDGESDDAKPKGGRDAASSLKSDWERIESLAQGGGGRR